MNKKQLIDNVVEKLKKYDDLMWYARTRPDKQLPMVNEGGKLIDYVETLKVKIERLYPKETTALSGHEQLYEHGFNSGMVAALRYILTMDESGLEQANEWFPELDS
jgi:hypothetical protein